MGKKNAIAAAKAAKKAKSQQKTERKEKKKVVKSKSKGKGGDDDSDDDLEGILDKNGKNPTKSPKNLSMGPPPVVLMQPSPRVRMGIISGVSEANFSVRTGKPTSTMTPFSTRPKKTNGASSSLRHVQVLDPHTLWPPPLPEEASCFSSVLVSCCGEFSSLHQNTFHHYRDFWCFDIQTQMWDRVETKIKPSARSGHRMAMWKHFILLFGGFYDPGITTRYHNDLWVFDTQEYSWKQIEFRETDPKPSPRSGFSFLPTADGILLHGGYCKEYKKGQRPVGVMLEDTWFLKLSLPTASDTPTTTPSSSSATPSAKLKPSKTVSKPSLTAKWERRKRPSDAFAPSLRSGCTMAMWGARNTGVMFGGVTDEGRHEETLESVFHCDTYGYQMTGKGKWISFTLKQPKAKGATAKSKKKQGKKGGKDDDWDDIRASSSNLEPVETTKNLQEAPPSDDPNATVPTPRYNTMLAVLRNTLYIYGGIFERGSKEYTLDDFYSLQLDKLDRFVCLKESSVVIPIEGPEESSSDEDEDGDGDDSDDDDDDDGYNEDLDNGEFDDGYDEGIEGGGDADDEDEDIFGVVPVLGTDLRVEDEKDGTPESPGMGKKTKKRKGKRAESMNLVPVEEGAAVNAEGEPEEEVDELRLKASQFMGTSKDTGRSEEDIISTPLPGETLAMFYARSRVYWTQAAQNASESRGKELRRVGFALAEEKYESYKPLLEEVEKILAEAGLDEEEMRRGASMMNQPGAGGGVQSRNRR